MTIADRPITDRALNAGRAAAEFAGARAGPLLDWVRENTPIVGAASARRRRRVVLQPYVRTYSLRKTVFKILAAPVLAFFCLLYGFFFALTAPTLIVAFVVPLVILAALIIWALPHQRTAPTLAIELLFPAFFV